MSRQPVRRRTRTLRQQIERMGRAQAAFLVVSILIVCAIVGGSALAIIVDAVQSEDSDADPEEFNSNRQGEFIAELQANVDANPDDAAAMGLLANVLAQDGRIDEAIDWYERSLAIDPANTQVRLSFATSLMEAGKPADAEIQYVKILETDPNQAEAHYYLGELYRAWTPPRIDEAVAHFNQVLAIAPGSVVAERATEALAALGIGTPEATPAVATPE